MQARHAYGPAVPCRCRARRRTSAHALAHTPAGLIYSIVTMPFETAKNRMAFQKPDPVTKEMPYRRWLIGPPPPSHDSAPSTSLDHLKAQAHSYAPQSAT